MYVDVCMYVVCGCMYVCDVCMYVWMDGWMDGCVYADAHV